MRTKRRRNHVPKEFLGAFKIGHRAAVREFIDEDLSWDLLEKVQKYNDPEARKALEWITRYNNEFYRGVLKKNDPNAIHGNKIVPGEMDKYGQPITYYKLATDAHNRRREDVIHEARSNKPNDKRAVSEVVSLDTYEQNLQNIDDPVRNKSIFNENRDLNHEDHLIELIDSKDNSKSKK